MDKERQEKIRKICYELNKELKLVNIIFTNVINGLRPPQEFEKAVKGFLEKRQLLNNLNQGILIGIKELKFIIFPLTGDPEKDINQKNLSQGS